jgi:hypothetical protein
VFLLALPSLGLDRRMKRANLASAEPCSFNSALTFVDVGALPMSTRKSDLAKLSSSAFR